VSDDRIETVSKRMVPQLVIIKYRLESSDFRLSAYNKTLVNYFTSQSCKGFPKLAALQTY